MCIFRTPFTFCNTSSSAFCDTSFIVELGTAGNEPVVSAIHGCCQQKGNEGIDPGPVEALEASSSGHHGPGSVGVRKGDVWVSLKELP